MTNAPDAAASPKPRRSWRHLLLGALLLLVLGLVATELLARFALGLGDPPLSVADDEIEYLFKPDSTFQRFGNTIRFNRWSMRSPDFVETKAPSELRVLVLGDSVPNGGSLTDDADLATTLVAKQLEETHAGPVVVGNVSAGSWGPPNLLAYVDRFGFLDADYAVIVLNTEDAWDVPAATSPVGSDPSFPDSAPLLATQELVSRYLVPRLIGATAPVATADPSANIPQATAALAQLITKAHEQDVKVALIYWPRRPETSGEYEAGYLPLKDVAAEAGVPFVEARDWMKDGEDIYRDIIHPNDQGQQVLAEVIMATLEQLQPGSESTTRPATPPSL